MVINQPGSKCFVLYPATNARDWATFAIHASSNFVV